MVRLNSVVLRAPEATMQLERILKHVVLYGIFAGILAGVGFGQASSSLAFEVATVKPSAYDVMKLAVMVRNGETPAIGPHVDKARAQYTFMTLKDLMAV